MLPTKAPWAVRCSKAESLAWKLPLREDPAKTRRTGRAFSYVERLAILNLVTKTVAWARRRQSKMQVTVELLLIKSEGNIEAVTTSRILTWSWVSLINAISITFFIFFIMVWYLVSGILRNISEWGFLDMSCRFQSMYPFYCSFEVDRIAIRFGEVGGLYLFLASLDSDVIVVLCIDFWNNPH